LVKATILPADQYGIDIDDISENALQVVQTLQDAGYEAYLVGGCVRDLILGIKPKDFDVSTNATPEQIKGLFKNSRIVGRRFKLAHIRFGYEVIEVATFRADATDRESVSSHEMSQGDQGQLIRDNVYGSIEEDVVRRDFTANALYLDPAKQTIIDFMDGAADIEKKVLRSIGDPTQRFREDPVRMLRIVRFAAKLDFSMEPEALQMIDEEAKLLGHVSPARLFEEVLKLFHGGAAHDTFKMLIKHGLFKYLFPFTEQCLVEGEEGMPERALKNTDKRIHQGKPVIPAFLFACMMWDPVRADAQVLMSDGTPEPQAWRIAMSDALRDQSQYVAVPKRLAEIILDIWNIHFRLIKRNPRMVKACLNNRRFRAAYDFLLLRANLYEVDQDVADWWTRIQEVDSEDKEDMIIELGRQYKTERAQHRQDEANGNSVNYNGNSVHHQENSQPNFNNNRQQPRSNKYKRHKKTSSRKTSGGGRQHNGNGATSERYQQQSSAPDAKKTVKVRKKRRVVADQSKKSRSRHPTRRNKTATS